MIQEKPGQSIVSLYSNVRTSHVSWLWKPYFPIGKITLLEGDPGDGKSTMMMHLISEITIGGSAPDGFCFGRPKKVIYQCSEDGVSDTIKPRLVNCGADCKYVAYINEEVHTGLTLDDERIRQAIVEFSPVLVVIDPIQAYLGSDSDLAVAGRDRRLMRRLSLWATTYDCAIVLIGHLNKREGSKGLYRGLGSIDVIAAARSVLQVERDETDPDIRIVKQIKNSLGPANTEIRYEIKPETGFRWIVDAPEELEEPVEQVQDENLNKKEKAATIIKNILQVEDVRAKDIFSLMDRNEISRRTAEEVKKEIGIQSVRKMNEWYWHLEYGEMQ